MILRTFIFTLSFVGLFSTKAWTQNQTDSLIIYHCSESKSVYPRLTFADLLLEERYADRQIKKGFDKKILALIATQDSLEITNLKYIEPRFAIVYSFNGKPGVIIFDEFGRLKFDPKDNKTYKSSDIIKLTEQYVPKLRKVRQKQNK